WIIGFCCVSLWSQAQKLQSPSGALSLTFSIEEGGVPTYALQYKGQAVVKPSRLGFSLTGNTRKSEFGEQTDGGEEVESSSLATGFKLVGQRESSFDETWQPVW